jgi:hypothetical protein
MIAAVYYPIFRVVSALFVVGVSRDLQCNCSSLRLTPFPFVPHPTGFLLGASLRGVADL